MKHVEHANQSHHARDWNAAVSNTGGLRVLVVEDEVLLALSLEDDLRDAGLSMLGPYTTLERALQASRSEGFDLALLDVNLHGEAVFPLADELIARNVPIVFLTGYGAADLPERFRALPRLQKPYEPSVLVRELRRTAGAA
jgi:DNA-binding response OmpR family regulator